ncbi:MAG: hypothetical protein IJ664_04595 [Clostridia bacterium]|nr:hypothetical protein [Clostridia bacterium]
MAHTTIPIESKPFDEAVEGMNSAAERLDDMLFNFLQGLDPSRDEVDRTLYEIARMRILLDAVEKLIVNYLKHC